MVNCIVCVNQQEHIIQVKTLNWQSLYDWKPPLLYFSQQHRPTIRNLHRHQVANTVHYRNDNRKSYRSAYNWWPGNSQGATSSHSWAGKWSTTSFVNSAHHGVSRYHNRQSGSLICKPNAENKISMSPQLLARYIQNTHRLTAEINAVRQEGTSLTRWTANQLLVWYRK